MSHVNLASVQVLKTSYFSSVNPWESFDMTCLLCCSEAEKKTTLDQALRGVLGDQIVSRLAGIYLEVHHTTLREGFCL